MTFHGFLFLTSQALHSKFPIEFLGFSVRYFLTHSRFFFNASRCSLLPFTAILEPILTVLDALFVLDPFGRPRFYFNFKLKKPN